MRAQSSHPPSVNPALAAPSVIQSSQGFRVARVIRAARRGVAAALVAALPALPVLSAGVPASCRIAFFVSLPRSLTTPAAVAPRLEAGALAMPQRASPRKRGPATGASDKASAGQARMGAKRSKSATSAGGEAASKATAEASPANAEKRQHLQGREQDVKRLRDAPDFWLIKSEPHEFPLEALQGSPNGQGFWDGVRNYVARNNMQGMKVGDQAFFYHSSCKEPGCVGICEVAVEAAVDATALDPNHKYYDAKSDPAKPRWFGVEFKYVRHLRRPVTLQELKMHKDGPLASMDLFRQSRLSVQRVSKAEWEFILALEKQEPPA